MLRLLRWLWTGDGHVHSWETIMSGALTESGVTRPIGNYYNLRCKICGNIKARMLY